MKSPIKTRSLVTLATLSLALLAFAPAAQAQTATWTGGNTFKSYAGATNWNPSGVPLGATYTVIVPDSSSLVYDVSSNGVIDALSFGASSVFRLTNGWGLTVNGPALVKGQLEASGAGSKLIAPANVTALQVNPRLYATSGGQLLVGASTYTWDRLNSAATLLSATGPNSLVDLKSVTSMLVSYGDGGSWSYAINAKTNGVIDLSGLAQLTGPGQDDWLDFNIDSGGNVKLDELRRTSGRIRFNIGVPFYEIPLLDNSSDAHFLLSSNATLSVPSLLTFASANITLGQDAELTAPELDSITAANISLAAGADIYAPSLTFMDSVPLTITGNGSFRATNLVTYRNSDIHVLPGRDFRPGLLTDVNGSRVSVNGGSQLAIGATAYTTPGDWRYSTVFTANGAGSLLSLTNLLSLRVEGGYAGAWNHSVTASSNAIVDLSNLISVVGANQNTYDSDDWLAFNIRSGGELRLNSLRYITRRTKFSVEVPRYDLPSLESADNTWFVLPDGARLDSTNLTSLTNSWITFGFNSTFNAPRLRNVVDMDVNLDVGRILNTPPFTNIYASRLSVAGGSTLNVGAPSYDIPVDWRWSPTLFSADGAGSMLNLPTVKTLRVHGGHNAGWVYSITANNSGLIDFSGLETIIGADPNAWGSDDWLDFNVRNGGSIALTSLKQITRRTRFNIDVPQFTMPALEQADTTVFNLANGTRLNIPNATKLENCTFNYGINSVLSAPNLLSVNNQSFSAGPGRTVIVPAFTNINGARLAVTGGSNLTVAAVAYQTPSDWKGSHTIFFADGTGSLLDLASVTNLQISQGNDAAWNTWITATNNGTIDLSGLLTVTGPQAWSDDTLILNVQNSSTIRLTNLLQTTGNIRFNIGDSATLNTPSLTSIEYGQITLGFNSTMNAPQLRSFLDSTLALSPGKTLNAPPFTNIFASRLSVTGGSTLQVGALSYDTPVDWRWSPTLLSADGAGSLIDLSAMKTFRVHGGHNATWYYSVTANNSGTIDLSGLDTIIGADTGLWGSDDWLSFSSSGAGLLRLGNASVTRRVQFTTSGQGSRSEFASLYLRAPSTVNINNRGTLNVKGNLRFENTDPNQIQVTGGYVQMDGNDPQTLEAGGRNLGPTGASSLNFGYSQLIVGNSNKPTPTIVRLQDAINNGQRGSGGESEALYLYGLDGQGLRLINGSKLILNSVPVYALMGGQMRLLNTLVSPATNSLTFDGGILANAAGPKITNMTPAAAITPPISFVDVTFDIPIAAATFSTADVTITGPVGNVSATAITPVAGNTYRISFAAQAVDGTYTVRVGPNVNEAAQNLAGMDQDSDGLAGESLEDAFISTFRIDGSSPVIAGAMAVQNGTRVGVTFNEPVSPAFATNPANYSVNGLTPSRAVLQTNGSQVALWVNTLVGETFALTVTNLVDPLGNSTSLSFTGAITSFEARDIGTVGTNPKEPGSTLTFTGSDFEMASSGNDYFWGTSDGGHFVYETRPGDFDVRVEVTRLDRQENYSQAGIMWRESTAANARRVYVCLTHPSAGNQYYSIVRFTPGVAGVEWPGTSGPAVSVLPSWLRLKRTGNVFTAYRGTDGTNWFELGRLTNSFTATGLLGPAGSARNNNSGVYSTAWYQNYSDLTPSVLSHPQSQIVASGSNVVFGVTARGMPALAYQWYWNGAPIVGATSNILVRNLVTTNHVGDYFVVITNSYGSATSLVANLVVDGVGGGGFEADTMPTPYGNNSVTVSDWSRVGRLVAGLDTPLSSSEFMRADCAPRTNSALGTFPLGDARLTVADWAQAGRYAAGLDPLTPAGGPNQAGAGDARPFGLASKSFGDAQSTVRIHSTTAARGQTFVLPVALAGEGDVNALGFSITFDATRLKFEGVVAAEGASGAVLQVNSSAAQQGRIGIALAKPAGQSFQIGEASILNLRLTALSELGDTTVAIADAPVAREIVNTVAEPQPADYIDGSVTLIEAGRLTAPVTITGGVVRLSMRGQAGATYRIEASTDLVTWELLGLREGSAEPVSIDDPAAAQHQQRFYRVIPQP